MSCLCPQLAVLASSSQASVPPDMHTFETFQVCLLCQFPWHRLIQYMCPSDAISIESIDITDACIEIGCSLEYTLMSHGPEMNIMVSAPCADRHDISKDNPLPWGEHWYTQISVRVRLSRWWGQLEMQQKSYEQMQSIQNILTVWLVKCFKKRCINGEAHFHERPFREQSNSNAAPPQNNPPDPERRSALH